MNALVEHSTICGFENIYEPHIICLFSNYLPANSDIGN